MTWLQGPAAAALVPALVVVPLLGAAVLLALRNLGDRAAAGIATAIAGATAALAVLAALAAAPYDAPGPGLAVDVPWIPVDLPLVERLRGLLRSSGDADGVRR